MPNHPLTIQLLTVLDFPLAAPSANLFGKISPTTAAHVLEQLGDQIEYVLDGLNLRRYFATVVGADDVARGKPEPDLFLLAAERLNLPSEACLVFEDSLAGLEAAHRAGMQSIAVTTSHAAEEMVQRPSVRQAIADFTQFQLAQHIR